MPGDHDIVNSTVSQLTDFGHKTASMWNYIADTATIGGNPIIDSVFKVPMKETEKPIEDK